MKSLLLLFSALILLTSCSSDDSSGVASNGTLLKKAVGYSGETSEFFYTGNKINKIVTTDDSRFEYVYTGNLITQILYYKNEILKQKEVMQYNSDEKLFLKKVFDYPSKSAFKSEYIYNANGTVSIFNYLGDFNSQTNQFGERKVYLSPNGNVQKIEDFVIINGVNQTKTKTFTYDDKNNFVNAILGYNKLKYWDSGLAGDCANNITAEIFTTTENSSSYTVERVYTYYPNGYIKTMNFSDMVVEYFYQ